MAAQKAKKKGDILEVTGATLAKPSPKKKGAVAPKARAVPGEAVPPKVKAKPKAAKPKAKPKLAEAPKPAEDFGKCDACGTPLIKILYDSRNYPDFYTIVCNNGNCPKYRWIVGHQGEVPPGVRLPPGA